MLSILLLLQVRGKMTAERLAGELEVSVRTIYRDVLALQAAGVPLYADAGAGGGYQLIAGYRTDLTGFTTTESQALFLLGLPQAATELGLGDGLSAARHKLLAALPPHVQAEAALFQSRFHLDAPAWYTQDAEVPALPAVVAALRQNRAMDIRYRRWKAPTDVDRRVEPFGLVLKAGCWYLVAGPTPRTYRVDQILDCTITEEAFEPPDGFDLPAYWEAYQRDFLTRLYQGEAIVRASPRIAASLTSATQVDGAGEADGWLRLSIPIESIERAHDTFVALGADVEVLAPVELRHRLARTFQALATRYESA